MAYKRISPSPITEGGTGAQTFTTNGIVVGNGTSALSAISAGTTGTVLAGATSSNPSFTATPSVTSITIANTPSAATDGANKSYVDSIAAGLEFKSATYAATTATLNATYINGVAGVGATLINAGTLAAFTVDGTTPPITSRILVKNQSTTFQNGIYILTTVGSGAIAWILTRALDYDQPSEIQAGDIVPVINGTVNAETFWLETASVTTIGTDPITFSQFFGGGAVTFNADSGSATPAAGILTIAGGTNITTSATGSTITITNTASSGALVYSVITADQTAAVNNGYICNKAGLLTLTLPTTSAVGSVIEVTGMNTNLGWKIAQNASQIIHFGATDTTTGTSGSLASTLKYDSIRIVCNVANLEWIVFPGTQGNITVV